MSLVLLSLLLFLSPLSSSSTTSRRLLQSTTTTTNTSCPLNFTALQNLLDISTKPPTNLDTPTRCQYIKAGLRLVESLYLQTSQNFLPPSTSSSSCWSKYQTLANSFVPNFDILSSCGFQSQWISQGCMNITTKSQFEALIPQSELNDVVSACNQSLTNGASCASCTTSLSSLQASYLTGGSVGNLSDCTAYPSIYAAAFANRFGPTDQGTAECLFGFNFSTSSASGSNNKKIVIFVVVIVFGVFLVLGVGGFCFIRRKKKGKVISGREMSLAVEMESINQSTTLVRYTFDDIREATKNFHRDNLIGKGGYGNVYKGVLKGGSEVAMKRFKNCSVLGDATFAHEVEVIASVRHVNLVALRGYCTATTPLEGHQRIIVCDLMRNGSLHDHLFEMREGEKKLGWPVRQKIVLGTARGLAYLHYGAQPGIIHRDIKASNILLDESFEPKVADFGLAKFNPEGMTHLSTRVAGTMGYVAPEYALYGQLTERSDVYSFGVVFLELLSGKKALMAVNDGQPSLVTEWAWDMVRKGRALDVIEDGMPNLGPPDVLEKYVLVAVLCSHPQLYARPTMDQVVKILDMDLPVPNIPERPISLIANIDDIEKSMSSSGSGNLSTAAGYQPYTVENGCPLRRNKEGENSGRPLRHNKEEGLNSGRPSRHNMEDGENAGT